MKLSWLCSLIVVLGACCCSASATEASLILVNAKLWTENPAQPTAQAVALDASRILAVGNNAAIRKLAGPDTRIIDLGGRLLLPGFNDSHVHFLIGGGSLITVHLGTANSQAEFKERIAQFARTLPQGAWLRNGLWDHQRWNPPVLPDHQLIDDVSGDHPAFLWRLDGHMALVNAQAMKLAVIDRNTKDVPGGEIERDKDGNPTYKVQADGTVDWYTYSGYRRYHSDCHVCHGPDGMGSTYAPALKDSLKTMSYGDFLGVVASGRKNVTSSQENVMPAFGDNPNVACYMDDLYVYLRARANDALGRVRPGKHEDKPKAATDAENSCMGKR